MPAAGSRISTLWLSVVLRISRLPLTVRLGSVLGIVTVAVSASPWGQSKRVHRDAGCQAFQECLQRGPVGVLGRLVSLELSLNALSIV